MSVHTDPLPAVDESPAHRLIIRAEGTHYWRAACTCGWTGHVRVADMECGADWAEHAGVTW